MMIAVVGEPTGIGGPEWAVMCSPRRRRCAGGPEHWARGETPAATCSRRATAVAWRKGKRARMMDETTSGFVAEVGVKGLTGFGTD